MLDCLPERRAAFKEVIKEVGMSYEEKLILRPQQLSQQKAKKVELQTAARRSLLIQDFVLLQFDVYLPRVNPTIKLMTVAGLETAPGREHWGDIHPVVFERRYDLHMQRIFFLRDTACALPRLGQEIARQVASIPGKKIVRIVNPRRMIHRTVETDWPGETLACRTGVHQHL